MHRYTAEQQRAFSMWPAPAEPDGSDSTVGNKEDTNRHATPVLGFLQKQTWLCLHALDWFGSVPPVRRVLMSGQYGRAHPNITSLWSLTHCWRKGHIACTQRRSRWVLRYPNADVNFCCFADPLIFIVLTVRRVMVVRFVCTACRWILEQPLSWCLALWPVGYCCCFYHFSVVTAARLTYEQEHRSFTLISI